LNMAMVLYEGRAIAFGPREEVFARVARSAGRQAAGAPGPIKGNLSSNAGGIP